MVFFVCNNCGVSLKKNKVDTHRGCFPRSLSCHDCEKDFFGDQYNSHTQCVSEDKKYGGVNYQGKDEPKGQKKQDQWVEGIRNNLHKASREDQTLLKKIIAMSNVPRKQAKFRNYAFPGLGVKNQQIINRLWEFIESVNKPLSTSTPLSANNEQNTSLDADAKPPPTKKAKLESSEDEKSSGNEALKPFKWLKYAKRELRNSSVQQLKIKDLKNKLIHSYKQKYPDYVTDDSILDQAIECFLENPKSTKLDINKKLVKLVQ